MTAKVIDGKEIAAQIRAELSKEIDELKSQGVTPGLAVIIVGEDPASQIYVRNKGKACEEIGMHSEIFEMPENTTEDEVLRKIDELNQDDSIDGILVQLPLPKTLDEKRLLNRIDPNKDVDGLHPVNIGRLVFGEKAFEPCTPQGCIELLKRSNVEISGAEAVVIGRSNLVGKPVAMMLLRENATVTICHSKTKDLPGVIRRADIVIAAIGQPKMITADMVKDGVAVIDVGTSRVDGKLFGDVDFDSVVHKAAAITPVPGGVGPMTITMLLVNTVKSARKRLS